jgi:acyl-lipid (7-3)-desaturase (Delta-4 desaturase)
MSPDADKLRQRKGFPVDVAEAVASEATQSTSGDVIRTMKTIGNNEVCIDGVVYDLTGFDHPGGESIAMFGGNDVTATYKMIHPYHTEKHLEKMKRVGKVSDFVTE